jgi:hypothetical protein
MGRKDKGSIVKCDKEKGKNSLPHPPKTNSLASITDTRLLNILVK